MYFYLITNIGYITEKWLFLCSYFLLLGYQHALISHPLDICFYLHLFNSDITKQNAYMLIDHIHFLLLTFE